MYYFKCEHLEPGCTHEDQDESREALERRANTHLEEHHDYSHVDDWVAESFKASGMTFLRPM